MQNKPNKFKILIIIILYHPDEKQIKQLINRCLDNNTYCDIFLSDNSDKNYNFAENNANRPRLIYEKNKGNLGIAGAQNKGMMFAVHHDYEYLIFFDQDSEIQPDFIDKLVKNFEQVRHKNPHIIAAGPSFIDPRVEGRRARKGMVLRNTYKKMVIASGCIIKTSDINKIGYMDEMLFIDHVDTEWCYRCLSRGYEVMQLSDIVMRHTIGEVKPIFWGYYKLQYQKPTRYYYLFRNSLILWGKNYIPLKDRLYILLRNISFVVKIFLLPHKIQRLKLMLKGLKDGWVILQKNLPKKSSREIK